MQTRRDFLKFAAMLSGSAAVSGFVPDSIRRAYAIAPEPGSTWQDAEHIVILMQENRSFDHVLGRLRGVRGFNDPRALRLPNGNSVFVQTDKAGESYAPWHLDIHDTRITFMGSVPHSRQSQVDAWNEGRHDAWVDAKRSYNQDYARVPMTMGHYNRDDVPFYYALADAFTVCDQHYCGVMSETTPNRSLFWTGTVRDRQSKDSGAFLHNEQFISGKMTWKTYPERLKDAGISWKFYQNDLWNGGLPEEEDEWLGNYGDNPLEYFAAYSVQVYPAFQKQQEIWIARFTGQVKQLETALAKTTDPNRASQLKMYIAYLKRSVKAARDSLAEGRQASYEKLTPQQKDLYHAAFVTNADDPDYHTLETLSYTEDGKERSMNAPKGDVFFQFRKDVNEGKLPTVSWLTAPQNFSDHPSAPWYGAWYVSELMDILTSNPDVWKKTIFVLSYDENDGYFDHAPSFVAADPKRPWTGGASDGIDTGLEYTYKADEIKLGVAEQQARTGPIGLGFRVPMIIASPWTRGGWVNSQLFDHSSTLQFLEQFVESKFGKSVRETNISPWRRAISGDLTSVFRPYDPAEPTLNFLDRDKFVVGIQKSKYKKVPTNYKALDADEIAQINRLGVGSSLVPKQEPGVRPACALPYELYAQAALDPDENAIMVHLRAGTRIHGKHASGAPFNVYLRNLKPGTEGEVNGMRAATYAVRAGDSLTQSFPLTLFENAQYEIDVHGPNGFFRTFRGGRDTPPLNVQITYEKRAGQYTGNLVLHLKNTGKQAFDTKIKDNAYGSSPVTQRVAAGQTHKLQLPVVQTHLWYDFSVNIAGMDAESRFAGHVETGRHSISDPFMGALGKS